MNTIITTTINPPTEAIIKYDNMLDWNLIVVGDERTPEDYKLEHGTFLSIDYCKENYPDLHKIIGTNNIDLGRMIGFIEAYKNGADIIATIDDDNIPLENWGKNIAVGQEVDAFEYFSVEKVFDPLGVTEHANLWHRGFPLELIDRRNYLRGNYVKVNPLVQANLWNGAPDIDAICRKMYPYDVNFGISHYFYGKRMICPFDTQNTIVHRSILKYYTTLPHIGRMDDIWGAYLLQSKIKDCVVFGPATVYQDRNIHDLNKDIDEEILGYKYSMEFIEACLDSYESALEYLPTRTRECYLAYQEYFN